MNENRSAIRIDIQLLRAVAVLSVVIFHFWPTALPSGFAGVDVFFVISGFLITSLIVREINSTGRLNLTNFWMRRIRRIFPASFTVIVATAAAVITFGSPEMVVNNFRHVAASAFSGENILLILDQADYFHSEDSVSALQHFWSLAVEEQFYLVWPIITVAIAAAGGTFVRIRRILGAAIVTIIVVSAGFALSVTLNETTGAYFNSFARAWELGLGALLAVTASRSRESTPSIRPWLYAATWIALAVTFVVPGLERGVPSWGPAPAVLLTVFLIASGSTLRASHSNRVAQTTIAVGRWVGDRSFSLYLWHWPLLIVAPTALGRELSTADLFISLILALVLSDLSYRLIETPFRSTTRWPAKRPLIAFALVAAMSAGISLSTFALSQRENLTVDDSAISDTVSSLYAEPRTFRNGVDVTGVSPFCFGAGSWVFDCANVNDASPNATTEARHDSCDQPAPCEVGDETGNVDVLFVGDSHSRNLRPAIDLVGEMLHWRVVAFTLSGCPLVFGHDAECDARNKTVFHEIEQRRRWDLVILSQSAKGMVGDARQSGSNDPAGDWRALLQRVIATGVPVATVRDNPALSTEAIACARVKFRTPNECSFSAKVGFRFTDYAAEEARKLGVHVIDLSPIYCPDGRCPLAMGGINMYMDSSHFSRAFNKTLAPFIAADLAAANLIKSE